MNRGRVTRQSALTLVEVLLVCGMLVLLAAIAMPALLQQVRARSLEMSARHLGSLVSLVRSQAQFDGRRYRIRFPTEEEREKGKASNQPIIEREDDPMNAPQQFNPVRESWVIGDTLLGRVWCAEVRLGRPTIAQLQEQRKNQTSEIEKLQVEAFEDFDPDLPPLVIEPDGSCEWATFVVTEAPRDTDLRDLVDEIRLEVIVDGFTGQSWVQRPFYDEELDLFEEKNWPVVLRQDLLTARVLTEDDVLEIQERRVIRGYEDSVTRTDKVDSEDLNSGSAEP
jgi:type II secretory pathway pseudopilin PulG